MGKIAAFGLSNIKIQTTPMWKGNSGTPHGGVSVKFSLFNSSVESAVNNFKFINSIFPNNMFTQYGIFQQAPSCYDVKVEGSRRWFMCSGDFKCEGKGVFRFPSNKFFTDIKVEGYDLESNNKYDGRIIKIPDIYEITLNFKSLLPDNFNNYLLQYSKTNTKIETEPAVYSKLFDPIKDKMDKIIKAATSDSVKNAENEKDAIQEAEFEGRDLIPQEDIVE